MNSNNNNNVNNNNNFIPRSYGLYPANPSLEEEMERLLNHRPVAFPVQYVMMRNDFVSNGIDTEYVPDDDRPTEFSYSQHATNGGHPRRFAQGITSSVFHRASRRPRKRQYCSFCKNNGERELVYVSHNLKTNSGIIQCPVLRNYRCPICGSTGDNAHTLKYCPFKKV